jgi:hypothetical protein
MKYDVITDHYAAALHIAEKPHYAIKLNLYDLTECISVIEKQVSRLKSEDLKLAYFNNLPADSIQTAAIKTLEKARGIIQDEIKKRSDSEQQAAEMLDYMEQVRKEREREKSPDGLNITAKDVVLFYKFFPFEDTEPHGMGLYKIWAARHGFKNFHSLRNKWSQLQNVNIPEGLDRVKVIGPEKVEYLAKLLIEPHHEKTREQILLFVAQYREKHQKRGP